MRPSRSSCRVDFQPQGESQLPRTTVIGQPMVAGDTAGLSRIALLTALAFLGLYLTTAGQRYLLS